MSGLNARASDTNDGRDVALEMETLSSGLENLDQALERQGLRIGSMVAVLTDPASPGDILAANMIANRPAYYYTLGKSPQQIRRNIKPVSNVDLKQVHIHEVASENPVETLRGVIENGDYPRGVTVIIDPVNELETTDTEQYQALLRELQEKIHESDGIAVLHGVGPEAEPANRWATEYMCDTVLRVLHRTLDETVEDYLAVEKLYPGQSLIDDDARIFELTRSLNMDIATSRNISP